MRTRSLITTPRRLRDFLQPALDAAGVMASLGIVQWSTRREMDEAALAMGLIAVIVFLLVSQLSGLHRRNDLGNADREMSLVAFTWTITLIGLVLISFAIQHTDYLPRTVVLGWFLLAPSMIGLGRMCMRIVERGVLRSGVGVRRVAIAGQNELGVQIRDNIIEDPSLRLQVVGFFDDRRLLRDEDANGESVEQEPELEGSLGDLISRARFGEIETIMVTLPMRAESRIRYLLDQLSDTTVSVYIVPDFFVFELLHSRWTQVGGLPAVSVFENPLYGVDGVAKRIADLCIATLTLAACAIPMLLIAIAVKISSPGPVFFRQKRYGLDGKEILVWKYRSMRTCDNGPVVKQATKGDPRITRVGGILRKTSLDELPQLFNVVSGSMSLVGPRPHASAHNEQYRSLIHGYMLRHKVKPGITGLAQVNGCRGETETIDKMERRVEWDHLYIRNWSIWLDFKILVKTAFVVWKRGEAY